jgi:hypothetical protein
MMRGGGAEAKIKIEQGKQKKKIVHQKSFKKNSCRDFSIGKIISLTGLSEVQCKGPPQIWKIQEK